MTVQTSLIEKRRVTTSRRVRSELDKSANSNWARPGYYMLFIVNTNVVPSVAWFVRLQ